MENQADSTTPESEHGPVSDTSSVSGVKKRNIPVLISVLIALALSVTGALLSFQQKKERFVSIALRSPSLPGWMIFTFQRDTARVDETAGVDLPEKKDKDDE